MRQPEETSLFHHLHVLRKVFYLPWLGDCGSQYVFFMGVGHVSGVMSLLLLSELQSVHHEKIAFPLNLFFIIKYNIYSRR